MKLKIGLALLAWTYQVQAKAVFAHFMVGNTVDFTLADWQNNIALAQTAHIDAFALNMAHGDSTNAVQLPLAFSAAVGKGFKLFFSFDYAGNGAWTQADVLTFLNTWIGNTAYYHVGGQPFVSTFEGPGNAIDWIQIKAITNCLYYPDYSSLGAKNALLAGGGAQIDGLFSWAAWPWGNTNMDTYVDASYGEFLDDRFGGIGDDFSHYMMAISPWFFTNLPGYDKNWLWRGDSLWHDRWLHANYLQPEFVEIITWNDFGESHYIGPLDDRQYDAFSIGEAPYNYVLDMPHDGWRALLPYLIDTYKNNVSTITQEILVGWYRPNPVSGSSCATGGTSGNTHSQYQVEFEPGDIVQDNIFYSALLSGPGASVTVTIGGVAINGGWAKTPFDGIGIYHGNVSMSGHTGAVTIALSRGGAVINGKAITTSCTNGIQNWNAWVGSAYGESITATPTSLTKQVCIAGTGAGNFLGLCQFTCNLGYCPVGACVCTQMGTQRPLPTSLNVLGYPAAGQSASYEGICAFACNYGYCPSSACGYTKEPESVPTISPFLPSACTGGSGAGNLGGLCGFACGYGYCPIIACSCTSKGALGTLPAYTGDDSGVPVSGLDTAVYGDLCKFAYQYGYNPPPTDVCTSSAGGSGTGSGEVCTSGSGLGNFGGLCDFSCNHGFCPPPCTCLTWGAQVALPASVGRTGYPVAGEDGSYAALCAFTCEYNYCPPGACSYDPPAGSGGVIYLPPSIWDISSGPIGCNGNSACTLVIPPSPLPAPETIDWPALTTTLLSSSNGAIYTKTTVFSVPQFTITEIDYWPVTISSGDAIYATFSPEQSVMPPSFIVNLPGTEITFPPSNYPSYSDYLPVATSTTSTTTPVFFTTTHGITIQPMPTISINTPTPTGTKTTRTVLTYTSTSSGNQPTCTSGCGTKPCLLFGCDNGCGFLGCGGGCGIFGCGGGCALPGCGGGCKTPGGCGSGTCPLTNPLCSNPGCEGGACPGGGTGEGDGEPEPTTASTCKPSTVTYTPCATTTVCPLKLKGRAPAPAAVCATTTSCEAPKSTVGCNIDPETGESNDGFSITYVVYPVDGTTSAGTNPLISLFESYGSQEVTGLTTGSSSIIGIMFWTLHLTPAQVKEVQQNSLVLSCTPQCRSGACASPFLRIPRREPRNETFDEEFSNIKARELGLVRQAIAPKELVMISQASGHTIAEYTQNYIYDSSEGTGTIVYILDSFVNTADAEFSKFASKFTVIDVTDGPPSPSITNADPKQHGTCVLSLIASDTYGVSKNIVPIAVGLPNEDFVPELVLLGLSLILEDFTKKGGSKSVGRAVLNLSLQIRTANAPAGWIDKCRILLKNLVALGVLPVTASGNDGTDTIDGYPALFAASDIPQIVVVGSVNSAGIRSSFSNLDSFVSVHAPGEGTKCANGLGGRVQLDGTSMATGMTSGIAAYFSSLSSVTATLNAISPVSAQIAAWKAYIVNLAYSRNGDSIEAVWNGVQWSSDSLTCPVNAKRQAGIPDDCEKPTTTSAASTPAATNTYNIYEWQCSGQTIVTKYGASAVSSTACNSQNGFFSNEGGIIAGDTFNVCGVTNTVGAVSGSFAVSGGGKTGKCTKVVQSPNTDYGCLGQSGDISSLSCDVELAYTCDLAVC